MTDSIYTSSSFENNRGGVRLSDHSPPGASASYHYHRTSSSSANTICEKSPSDVFGPEIPQGATQRYLKDCQQNYQLPPPPKFQSDYTFTNQRSAHRACTSIPRNPTGFAESTPPVNFEGAGSVIPTNPAIGDHISAECHLEPATVTPHNDSRPAARNGKTPLKTLNEPSCDVWRSPLDSETISEERDKTTTATGHTKVKTVAEMAAHCQLEGPLTGPLRDNRRSEIARNHPAWLPARQVQAGIMTTQQAIRRTPGIPSRIANDLCDGLQKYAQDVNNMLRQAINEVADYRLDIEYSDKVLCSSKLEASIMLEERNQLKRDFAELQTKHDELENRLARYHMEIENHKNRLREHLAKLDHQKESEDVTKETINQLLGTIKEFVIQPSAQWLHDDHHDNGSPRKVITALNAASIAALEQQENLPPRSSQHAQQRLLSAQNRIQSEHCEVVPSMNNALQPFNHSQNLGQFQAPLLASVPGQNGPPSSYPGVFNNSRCPTDNRTSSSAGWTRNSNYSRFQASKAPGRPYSRSGNACNSFMSGYKQHNGHDTAGSYVNPHNLRARHSTSINNRDFNSQHAFRPNAPEFRPGYSDCMGNDLSNTDTLYNLSYQNEPKPGSRPDYIEGSTAPFNSPTPRSASRGGFGGFEGSSSDYARPSPLIPQTPGFRSNQRYRNTTADHCDVQLQRKHAAGSLGQSYHTANYNQSGCTPVLYGQGGNGPRSASKTTKLGPGILTPKGGFSQDIDCDNERYARAFEGVWGLARS
nr:uncharacterized protein CTRU02_03952 [Colletotrichum truncatum]KAF6795992.1 hypothetical protein CTRU02_03952 [Colletotrichum truncatum]